MNTLDICKNFQRSQECLRKPKNLISLRNLRRKRSNRRRRKRRRKKTRRKKTRRKRRMKRRRMNGIMNGKMKTTVILEKIK